MFQMLQQWVQRPGGETKCRPTAARGWRVQTELAEKVGLASERQGEPAQGSDFACAMGPGRKECAQMVGSYAAPPWPSSPSHP